MWQLVYIAVCIFAPVHLSSSVFLFLDAVLHKPILLSPTIVSGFADVLGLIFLLKNRKIEFAYLSLQDEFNRRIMWMIVVSTAGAFITSCSLVFVTRVWCATLIVSATANLVMCTLCGIIQSKFTGLAPRYLPIIVNLEGQSSGFVTNDEVAIPPPIYQSE